MSTKHGMNPTLTDSQAPVGKKKPGGMNIFRAAWLRRRRCPEKKAGGPINGDPSSKGMLNQVVGSMRPLHLQSHRSPQHPRMQGATAPPSTNEQYEDVLWSPVSTPRRMTCLSPRSSASEEGTSRFASAVNLADLDCESEDGDHNPDIEEGDETIDVKAEQFIAQFYEQMRTQNCNRKVKMSSHQ
ncbi:uncharacterized protein LOC115675979 [Syzygium oleosum]|uniref:uncharacterized protein LOC115675979 n=1 Tax=Syzygium oleosum TaxID=219896 RepID=UPI0011D1A118|nr:uncharacterized protein LOC115675979 [Syzygium oleosum]